MLVSGFISIMCMTPIFAETKSPQYGCSFSSDPVPAEGEVILLEDNSQVMNVARGAVIRIGVNRSYSVRIQDSSGSCVNSATVLVSGSYTYDNTSGEILSINVSASFTNVPSLWTAGIQSQRTIVSGSSISQSIYYYSRFNDPYSCMVGEGNWYSGATFTIK